MTVKQALRLLDPIHPIGYREIAEICDEAEMADGINLLDLTENCLKEAYNIINIIVRMYYDDEHGAHGMCMRGTDE